MRKTVTCITCPLGCRIETEYDDKKIITASGYQCARGKTYVKDEVLNPARILTTTVYVPQSGSMLPVRSDKPLTKDRIREYIEKIKGINVSLPVKTGDVLLFNIEKGVNIIATTDLENNV